MRAILKDGMIIVAVESDDELEALGAWRKAAAGHVFAMSSKSDKGAAFQDLGPREELAPMPLNVVFDRCEPRWQPISNLALTPFVLRGRSYNSVEAFWQGLKFESEADRRRIADLWGTASKRVAVREPERPTFLYDGSTYATGTHGHRDLMLQACRAKFTQNFAARDALLATQARLLVHQTRRDSQTIPGALMADIWMRIRKDLRDGKLRDPGIKQEDGRILYFARDRERFGFLSHFHPASIEIDGEMWPTVEHYYQAQKSHEPAYRAAIRACATPGEAKQRAARPDPRKPSTRRSWFVETGAAPRPDWMEVKLDLMRAADHAKFFQHPDLAARLLATGTADLVEDSPFEVFWGIGPDGAGLNWAGRLLMEVRADLLMAGKGP